MGDETMKRDFADNKQRVAVCLSKWRTKHPGAAPPPKAEAMEYLVYDPIGEGTSTAKDLVQALNALDPTDPITIAIYSPGGSIFESEAMYAALKRHKGKVTCRIDGVAASAASYLAMAGDEIVMAPGSHMMLHMPSVAGYMSATEQDLRDIIDRFDVMTKQMVRVYAQRSGQDEAKIREMMQKETWVTAEQAIQLGFADTIDDGLQVKAHALDMGKFQYRHVPVAVQALSQLAPSGNGWAEVKSEQAEKPEETGGEDQAEMVDQLKTERERRERWRRRRDIAAQARLSLLKRQA